MEAPKPAPAFQYNALFVRHALALRFHFSPPDLVWPSASALGLTFEQLPEDMREKTIASIGFDAEKLDVALIGSILPTVRAGLDWLNDDPNRTFDDLERLLVEARSSGS